MGSKADFTLHRKNIRTMKTQLAILLIITAAICFLLPGCQWSRSSDGKRVIAAGEKFALKLAEDEVRFLIEE